MIVIAADTHKSTHSFSAVAEQTARVEAEKTFAADERGMLQTLRWAKGVGAERVWALEDCRHVSGRLERFLVASGERVVRVAPKLMGQSRRAERSAGKSDVIDARAIARAVLKDGVERFPVAFLDERAMEIRLLADHRADLVAERTRMQARLRWHLV
jgi:transposase